MEGGGTDRRDSGMLDDGGDPGGLETRDVDAGPCPARGEEGGPGGGGMVGRKARRAIILDTSAPYGLRLLPISDAREASTSRQSFSAYRYAVYALAMWQTQPSTPLVPIHSPGVTISQKIPRRNAPL